MTKRSLHILSAALVLILSQSSVSCGQDGKLKTGKVKLLDWKSNPCDNTYDPYKLVDRITESRMQDGATFLTVNFTDNCCAEFKPQISFKSNKLLLLPYKEFTGDYCD